MNDKTPDPCGSDSSTELGLLPIGTRIVFTKTLESGPDEFSPGNLYARKGDGGVITGHGTLEGYWVTWDGWKAPFGASRDEFEPLPNTEAQGR
jgi:hypothetical protein